MDIGSLDLTVRSDNGLKAAGIDTVEKLLAISWDELNSLNNIGRKSVYEIIWEVLQLHNGEILRRTQEWERKYPDHATDIKELYDKARKYDKITKIMMEL